MSTNFTNVSINLEVLMFMQQLKNQHLKKIAHPAMIKM